MPHPLLARRIAPCVLIALLSGYRPAAAQTATDVAPETSAASPSNDGALSWTVGYRIRYAGLDNQFRPGLSGNDQALELRTTVRADLQLPRGLLIAEEAYRDVTRAFTGAKARWAQRGGGVTAFAVFPVLTREAPAVARSARRALRVCAPRTRRASPARDQNRRLWTPGGRLFREAAGGAWDADAEVAWQWGSARASAASADVRDLQVSAHYMHASAGYTFAPSWEPRIGVEYDRGTGDTDASDGTWHRFDSLFGNRRVDLGPTSIYGALGRENISTFGARVSARPTSRSDLFAVFRTLRLAAAADAFSTSGIRDPTGRSGLQAGSQIDARARVSIVSGTLRLEAGATHLIAGPFLRHAPNVTRERNTTFFYTDLTYSFRSP